MNKQQEQCTSFDGEHSWCECPNGSKCHCGLTICVICEKEKDD
jgi:hypothetical protein